MQSASSGEQQSSSGDEECDDLDDLFQDVCLSELDDLSDVDDTDFDDKLREYSECESDPADAYDSDPADAYDDNSPGEFDEVVQDVDSPEMDMSFTAPPYSPIIPHDDQGIF